MGSETPPILELFAGDIVMLMNGRSVHSYYMLYHVTKCYATMQEIGHVCRDLRKDERAGCDIVSVPNPDEPIGKIVKRRLPQGSNCNWVWRTYGMTTMHKYTGGIQRQCLSPCWDNSTDAVKEVCKARWYSEEPLY